MRAKSPTLLILAMSLILGLVSPPILGGSTGQIAFADDRDSEGDDDDDDSEDDDDDSDALRVPEEYATIQSAIDAAPDGSTIQIAPGIYMESLRIDGKRLNLFGSETGRTDLLSRGGEGIVTYGRGGGGKLGHLSLSGGAYAIGSDRSGRGLPSGIRVVDVSVDGGFRGIYGAFTKLVIKDTSIQGMGWHAVSICLSKQLEVLSAFVADSQQVGVFVTDCGAKEVVIDDSTISGNLGGGVVVVGDIDTVAITDSFLTGNRTWGLLTHSVPKPLLINTSFSSTTEGNTPEYEGLADGIIAIDTSLLRMISSNSNSNVRVGVLLMGATHGIFTFSDSTANRFGLVIQGGASWEVNGEEQGDFTFGNTDQDILTDGNLPVPNAPLDVPDPP